MNEFPATIQILTETYTLLVVGDKEFEETAQRFFSIYDSEERAAAYELFSIKNKTIILRDSMGNLTKYGLLHAIWEILLSTLGQYYNHAGFAGFSYILFTVLKANNLSFLFENEGLQGADQTRE